MELAKNNLLSLANQNYGKERTEDKISQYQKNMKIFIASVQKEFSAMVSKYENKINELKKENQFLQRELKEKNKATPNISLELPINNLSPLKKKEKNLQCLQTYQSHFFSPFKSPFESDGFFGEIDNKVGIMSRSDKLYKSRFEVQSTKKKQKQEYLIDSLEMRKSNLNNNTEKMFGLLGKSRVENNEEEEENQECMTSKKKIKFADDSAHNSSLSSICQSLNTSFHARKSQQKSQQKKKQQKQKQESEKKMEEERQRIKKEQGLKNLLQVMRNNIQDTHHRHQVVKASKLLTTGQNSGKKVSNMKKSKVMINPVPVDTLKRNENKLKDQVETPTKQPSSILKKSKNVLTRSISNISAISFHSSGGED